MNEPAPPPPVARLSLGITGHREEKPVFAANREAIEQILTGIFEQVDNAATQAVAQAQAAGPQPTRLHSMLSDGVDQIAMATGQARGWELVAPLAFGRDLNIAINAEPVTLADAEALRGGRDAADPATQERAEQLRAWSDAAHLFELADRDDVIGELLLASLSAPYDMRAAQVLSAAVSERVALAACVMIEQIDLLIGIWDGATTSFVGGTGATIAMALDMGTPVLWIDAHSPERWRLLFAPEALPAIAQWPPPQEDREVILARLVRDALVPDAATTEGHGSKEPRLTAAVLDAEHWRPRSVRLWHAYRRVEALFGADTVRGGFRGLRQTYEDPETILTGSAADQIGTAGGLPGQDPHFMERVKAGILGRFAWTDGISARLSDTYRGGMILNFIFSALAIVGGIAYLPFATAQEKWIFASVELLLLIAILAITLIGQNRRWHGRWFETRRAAEYLRHAPILLTLGVARPTGRWPRGARTNWPELYARHSIRGVGLPRVRITRAYLSGALSGLLKPYVIGQRDYHRAKARRLHRAQQNLDTFSECLFILAIVSVTSYLALKLVGIFHLVDEDASTRISLSLTFLGVLLPTFGAAIAGIRYFGDFERFSAISEVAAERLDALAGRLALLETAPVDAIDYARLADLAHATDDIVVDEIESWQAVFAGKHITVPV